MNMIYLKAYSEQCLFDVDVDECEFHPCLDDGVCTNTDGGFDCGCPPGTHGNNSIPGGCVPFVSITRKLSYYQF